MENGKVTHKIYYYLFQKRKQGLLMLKRIDDKLYFIKINKCDSISNLNKMLTLVSIEKQDRINNLKLDSDKKLMLFADIIVRYMMSKILKNITINSIYFEKNEFGKPFIKNHPETQFNISHTRGAIAIGFSDKPIGVDIEKIKNPSIGATQSNKIAQRFFTKSEISYIVNSTKNKQEKFYEIWTRKEAYIKWVGCGLTIPLTSFNVLDKELKCKISTIQIDEYLISICNDKPFSLNDVIRLSETDIIKMAFELLNA